MILNLFAEIDFICNDQIEKLVNELETGKELNACLLGHFAFHQMLFESYQAKMSEMEHLINNRLNIPETKFIHEASAIIEDLDKPHSYVMAIAFLKKVPDFLFSAYLEYEDEDSAMEKYIAATQLCAEFPVLYREMKEKIMELANIKPA